MGPGTAASVGRAVGSLESGKVLFFVKLCFSLGDNETRFLSSAWSNGIAKNISYDPLHAIVRGTDATDADRADIAAMMERYARQARELVERISPRYASRLITGRTSFRPVEITGRASSVTKDDTRVEFPAGSTWAAFTDQVPHSAVAGQFALEQTFYLPVGAMQNEQLAPLRILEQRFHMPLA